MAESAGLDYAGLYVAAFDAQLGLWSALAPVLPTLAIRRSQLSARSDGLYVGAFDLGPSGYHASYWNVVFGQPPPATALARSGPIVDSGDADWDATLTDDGHLLTYTSGTLALDDGSISETFAAPATWAGGYSDLDLAVDRHGNAVVVTHSVTTHRIGISVRMPTGGYSGTSILEAELLPFPLTTSRMSLDAERSPTGRLGVVAGDFDARSPLALFEHDGG